MCMYVVVNLSTQVNISEYTYKCSGSSSGSYYLNVAVADFLPLFNNENEISVIILLSTLTLVKASNK